ncbi:MAG: T9SS type A sorting domain-containing protein, partial [candidate division KSB1 bacterium]|nr:T9SS type A sorting domain-containing protein [candidate division KSB1 bacterium]
REVVLTMPDDFPRPGLYYLSVENVWDAEGMPIDITRNSMAFEVTFPPQPPYLVRASLESETSIRLEFSQPLEIVSATDVSHYRIEPNIVLTEARLDELETNTVFLILDRKSPIGAFGVNYIITVSDVKNTAGLAIQPGRGDKASLLFSKPDLSQVITSPNPYRTDSGVDGITFANLTPEATIKILTLSGKVIKTLREQDGNGGVKWDLKDDTGNEVSSGIYLYYVTGNGDSRVGKFAVVR